MAGRSNGTYWQWGPMPLRLVLGLVFIAHGLDGLFGFFTDGGLKHTAWMFEQVGIRPALFWAWVNGVVQLAGGLFVVAGLFTRFVSFVLAIDMAVAVWKVHAGKGLFVQNNGYEFNLALVAMCVALMILGGGYISFDRVFRRKSPAK